MSTVWARRFTAHFNRDQVDEFSKPFAAEATVTGLRDRAVRGRRGIYANNTLDLGLSACSDDRRPDSVVVISNRVQCADPVFFEMFGLDIGAARVVVVKSRGHFRGGFDEFFRHEDVIEVDAPGLTSPVLSRFAWRHMPRPVLPIDDFADMDAPRGNDSTGNASAMKLDDLPTPCLVLDRQKLLRNIRAMAGNLARHQVPLRPHMKTAKSIDVARLALVGQPGGITVSTLAEAEYFASHGIVDILYAVGITPAKLDQVARLNADGANITVITDDPVAADAIAAHPANINALIEIDCGEQRGGVLVSEDLISELANRLGPRLIGVMTHAGHSYQGRSAAEITQIAELERSHVVYAAQRLRGEGHAISIVSAGSSPTGRHAETMNGLTEFRAGVYMFGDLFQAEIETHARDSIALTVLTSVIGRPSGRLLIDAGALALSKDRSTEQTPTRFWFWPGAGCRRRAGSGRRDCPEGVSGTRRDRGGRGPAA